jgi:nifR3 family TIM-barrel protein
MMTELRPFQIGDVTVGFPVVLAALAGYSDLPYRLICRRLGAPYCTTEMMLDRQMLMPGRLRRRMATLTDEDHPVAAQLIGNDPDDMAPAAEACCQLGFDVIDLNFACPVRKALSRRRGGWLMREPELVGGIVRAVLAASSRPVTLKIRMSYDRADADCAAFWRIAEEAFDAGVAGICVHARPVEATYTGKADWSFLAAVKRRFPDRTIIGSGDVLTPADALAMLERTGVDGVALARGGLCNPWFFRQVADLAAGREPHRASLAEQRALLEGHFRAACEFYGQVRGPKMMRKFGIKYARSHPTPSKVRCAFVSVRNARDWRAVLDELYPYGEAAPALAGEGDAPK